MVKTSFCLHDGYPGHHRRGPGCPEPATTERSVSAYGALAHRAPLGISAHHRDTGGPVRKRSRRDGGVGLSAEDLPRISSAFPHRRPGSFRRNTRQNAHRASGIRDHSLRRRHLHRARDSFRSGGRARRNHCSECGNRAASRNRGRVPSRLPTRVAGGARSRLHRLERTATGVLYWGRAKQVRCVCRFAHGGGSPAGVSDQLFRIPEQFLSPWRHGKRQRDKTHRCRRLDGRPPRGGKNVPAFDRRLPPLLEESRKYYQDYLARTVSLELPDAQLQQAYDWARISEFQGLVTNPYLGTALVAGYRTSGESQRPGFAWFFGRDSFWTSLALNAAGDFSTTRTALAFISKFQREDGKIPHEISQGANFVDWFKGYPYPYASADATPLYLIAMNDYVNASGDTAFAKEKWDSLWKAYEFLRSTYGEHGFAKNQGVGHGWVEGGPLLPVKTELYQTGLGIEALRALSNLAHLAGKEDASKELARNFAQQRRSESVV